MKVVFDHKGVNSNSPMTISVGFSMPQQRIRNTICHLKSLKTLPSTEIESTDEE